MERKSVSIPAIHCGHCVMTIEREAGEITGVNSVKVDEVSKQAIFEWENPASWGVIKELLEEIEYPPQELLGA